MNRFCLLAVALSFPPGLVTAGEMGSGNTGDIAAPVEDEAGSESSDWRERLESIVELLEDEDG